MQRRYVALAECVLTEVIAMIPRRQSFLGEQLKAFFEWKKATLRSSQCRPTSPIHWARYRLGSYTIIDRQYWKMDFYDISVNSQFNIAILQSILK